MSNNTAGGTSELKRTDEELRELSIKGDGNAQNELYHRYAPKLWGVCLRYAKNRMSAEDILQEGFIRIFTYLDKYSGEGSFEGWLRRIMVNTAINYYKKNLKTGKEMEYTEVFAAKSYEPDAISQISNEEVLGLVQELPDGYRTVFNLYVVEGYSHRDIGEMMGISENTSKSQLSRARNLLQEKIQKLYGKK